ncbi:hypothetical protein D3C87_1522360 [compost metagenome]
MGLVQDHVRHVGHLAGIRVQDVAEDLGGHDEHRGLGREHHVTGDEADLVGQSRLEVAVLLVGEGLERRGVDAARLRLEGEEDGEFGHHGLARAGGSRDQHGAPGCKGLHRLDLEGVERELLSPGEGGDERLGVRSWHGHGRAFLKFLRSVTRALPHAKRYSGASPWPGRG